MTLEERFKGKVVLVTGGCGSIGRHIVEKLISFDVKEIRIYDSSESLLFQTEQRYANPERAKGPLLSGHHRHPVLRLINGDVRDKDHLRFNLHGVHYAFHAAALKHVPNCEYNPFEAIKTNVLGTQNLIEGSVEAGVERLVVISSDKAINPVNTLGASKLLSEKLALSPLLEHRNTRVSCVRFGNVLDSDGSVIPIFRSQIERGQPVTITHPEMKRFFMSIGDAVKLVLDAAHLMEGREVFVLKMTAMRIVDLAKVLIEELAPKSGFKPSDIELQYIGMRPGERLNESLLTEEEIEFTRELPDMYVYRPPVYAPHVVEGRPQGKLNIKPLSTNTVQILTQEEIRQELRRHKMLDRIERRTRPSKKQSGAGAA